MKLKNYLVFDNFLNEKSRELLIFFYLKFTLIHYSKNESWKFYVHDSTT